MATIYGIEPDFNIWGPSKPFIQSKRWVKADPKGKRRRPAKYPKRRNEAVYSVGYPDLRDHNVPGFPHNPRRGPVYVICIRDVPGDFATAHRFMDLKLAEFKLAAEHALKLQELRNQK